MSTRYVTRSVWFILLAAGHMAHVCAQPRPGVMALSEDQYNRAMNGEVIDVGEPRSQVYKSCADGAVDRWMLFWTVNIPDSDEYDGFDFKTNREGELPLAERYGDFVPTEIDTVNHRKYFKVIRPRFLREQYGLYRRDSIIVTYDNVPQSNYDATVIDVHRAPILFLHGLDGDSDTFEAMQNALVVDEYQVPELMARPSYNEASFGSIQGQGGFVRQQVLELLDQAREHDFFVGKVDVVAHSLGGLIARVYAQSLAGFPYGKDIRSLITICTPHSGSEMANYVLDEWGHLSLCEYDLFEDMYFCGGAITDLRTDSELIDDLLNVVQFQLAPNLPCRAVTTWTAEGICDMDIFDTPFGNIVDCATLFGQSPHDGVVKVISQRGGLYGSRIFTLGGQGHIGAANNPFIINDVRTALLTDPRGPKFSQYGFHPDNLALPGSVVDVRSHQPEHTGVNRGSSSLAILQPGNGAAFHPGDTVTFEFDCSSDITFLTALIGNEEVEPVPWDTVVSTSPLSFQWTVPDSWLGAFEISVVGFDASMTIVADDQSDFVITTDALLVQLVIQPDEIFCTQDALSFYQVFATYSDGNVVNVTQSAGTTAGIANGAAASIQQAGVLLGLSPDSTTMTVFYEGLVATADVYVYATDTTNIDDAEFAADERFFCGGDAVVHFYDWSGGTPDSIRWSFPGGVPVTSTGSEPVVTYAALGEYPVQLIAHYGIYSDTLLADSFIIVNEAPSVMVELVSGVLQCTGDAVDLYIWYLDGDVLTADSGATLTPLISGDYSVEVTDSTGCSTLTEPLFIEVSTSLRPIGFTERVRVYPNPVAGELWVESTNPVSGYTITNAMGEVVMRSSVASTKRFNLSLGRLCAGAYAISLTFPENGSSVLRFVKE